jgi:hypothetical protein
MDPSAKVTCPLLLSTSCGFCGKNGHTAKFCKEAKLNKMVKPETIITKKKTFNDGEWIPAPNKRVWNDKTRIITPEIITPIFVNKVDDFFTCKEIDVDSKSLPVISWADIARGNIPPVTFQSRPTGMSWADWDDE